MDLNQTALVVIDVQKAFNDPKWGERNNLHAESNIAKLVKRWRQQQQTVIHIKHLSDKVDSLFHPEHDGFECKEIVVPFPDEKIITKKENSAFIGTNLESYLKELQLTTVVITGLTTPHCVSTTTRMSSNLGFNTILLSDATAAFGIYDHKGNYIDPDTIHAISLATLHDEFATIVSTDQLIETIDENHPLRF
ncbi:cysteine hydrolase family protein [Bacillus sp. JCM 19041]|uniref:cysteine hydrolase family protein n=1 Tax=Bacillus sp. JCM 19041 TaxID=1460637 RepID=UPI0012E12413